MHRNTLNAPFPSTIQRLTTREKGQQIMMFVFLSSENWLLHTCQRGTRLQPVSLHHRIFIERSQTHSQPASLALKLGGVNGGWVLGSTHTHTHCISRDYSLLGQPFLSSTIFTSIIILLFSLCFVALVAFLIDHKPFLFLLFLKLIHFKQRSSL